MCVQVDIHLMTSESSGEWKFLGTESTVNGRLYFSIPHAQRLEQGLHPVKMVVRGDHTSVDFHLAVLPPATEVVIFSIDGAFTASVSVSGKDPKLRAAAVDVARCVKPAIM